MEGRIGLAQHDQKEEISNKVEPTFNWPAHDKELLASVIDKKGITAAKIKIIPSVFPLMGGNKRFAETQLFDSEFARLVSVRTNGKGDDYDSMHSNDDLLFIELFNPTTKKLSYLPTPLCTNYLTPLSSTQFLSCTKDTFTLWTRSGETITSTHIKKANEGFVHWGTWSVEKISRVELFISQLGH